MKKTRISLFAPIFVLGASTLSPAGSYARNAPRGPDFDCDYQDDMAIGAPRDDHTLNEGGSVYIRYSQWQGGTPILRFDQDNPSAVEGDVEAFDHFGHALAYGDFDHDAYDDLAIGVPDEDVGTPVVASAGTVNILYGGPTVGLTATGDQFWHGNSTGITLLDPHQGHSLGRVLAAGDFDGDGFDDLASTYDFDSGSGVSGGILILYGSSGGLAASGHQIFNQTTSGIAGDGAEGNDGWGDALATGDFDCDGFDDIAVGAPGEHITGFSGLAHGAVTVIYGSSSGLTASGSQWWNQDTLIGTPEDSDSFGRSLAAGNFNGDSVSGIDCVDLAIGVPIETIGSGVGAATANGAVSVIYGGSSGLTATGNQLFYQGNGLPGTPTSNGEIGNSLTFGRLNNDAYDDLVIGADEADPGGNQSAGEIYLVKGSSGGLTGTGSERWDAATTSVAGTREASDNWSTGLTYARFIDDSTIFVGAPGEDTGAGASTSIRLNTSFASFGIVDSYESTQSDYGGTSGNYENFGFSYPAPRLKAECGS